MTFIHISMPLLRLRFLFRWGGVRGEKGVGGLFVFFFFFFFFFGGGGGGGGGGGANLDSI